MGHVRRKFSTQYSSFLFKIKVFGGQTQYAVNQNHSAEMTSADTPFLYELHKSNLSLMIPPKISMMTLKYS